MFLNDVHISDNTGDGIRFTAPVKHGKLDARYRTISGTGGNGISAYRSVVLRNVTVTGNGGAGVVTERHMTLKDSASAGNGPSSDLASFFRPHLKNTLCDHSVDLGGGTFGVCSMD